MAKKEKEYLNEISDSESENSYSEFLEDWNEIFNENHSEKYKVLSFANFGPKSEYWLLIVTGCRLKTFCLLSNLGM